jgi:hypothetical protein
MYSTAYAKAIRVNHLEQCRTYGCGALLMLRDASFIGSRRKRWADSTHALTWAVKRAPKEGPGTKVRVPGLERPVSVRFDSSGGALYVVDFGVIRHDDKGAHPERQTGAIWRIRRTR